MLCTQHETAPFLWFFLSVQMPSGWRNGGGEDVHQEGPSGGSGARGGVSVRDGQGTRHPQLSQCAALSTVASVQRERHWYGRLRLEKRPRHPLDSELVARHFPLACGAEMWSHPRYVLQNDISTAAHSTISSLFSICTPFTRFLSRRVLQNKIKKTKTTAPRPSFKAVRAGQARKCSLFYSHILLWI